MAMRGPTKGLPYHDELYGTWRNMRQRCWNQKHPQYPSYGGRGIDIAPEWDKFESFYYWALENGFEYIPVGKRGKMSLDRIDNDKGYGPDNCRWATYRDQMINRYRREYGGDPASNTLECRIIELEQQVKDLMEVIYNGN